MTPALSEIVEEAYRRFESHPPGNLGVCVACCMDPAMEKEMIRRRPRDLSLEQLREWFDAAAADPMPPEIQTFLLPRVLEGLARGEEMSIHGPDLALHRFVPLLTERASDLLERFLPALLQEHARAGTSDLEPLLCMFAVAGVGRDRIADALVSIPADDLIPALHREWIGRWALPQIGQGPFWPEKDGAMQIFRDPRLRKVIDGTVLRAPSGSPLFEQAGAVMDLFDLYVPRA